VIKINEVIEIKWVIEIKQNLSDRPA